MTQLSELFITKIRAQQRLLQVRESQDFVREWQKEWRSTREIYGRLLRKVQDIDVDTGVKQDVAHLLDYVYANQEQLRQMRILMDSLSREYASDTLHTSLVIDTFETEIKQMRMLPLSTITAPFGRMIRDLAQTTHKEAILYVDWTLQRLFP